VTMTRLLAIDDDNYVISLVRAVAEIEDFEVRTARSAAVFKFIYEDFAPDIIGLDIFMPETDGFELLKYLAARACRAHLIVFAESGNNFGKMAEQMAIAYGLKVVGNLRKPLFIPDLRRHLAALRATHGGDSRRGDASTPAA
jgi:CheY-like chemotaxis protein